VSVGTAANGTVTLNGTNVVYLPNADYFGQDSFTYTIDDGDPASQAVGTVTVTVTPVNDQPVAGNDSTNTAEDTPVTLTASGLTANDRPGPANENTQTLRIVGVGTAAHGTVTVGSGLVSYRPDPDFNGTDTFTYTIDDGDLNSTALGTVTVTVAAVNDPPTAGNDALSTAEGVPLTVPASTLTSNDRPGPADEMSQQLRIVVGGFGAPAHGTVTFDGTNVVYTPAPGFAGTDTFTYTIDDGDPNARAVGTVTVTVAPVNQPPTAADDAVSTAEDTALTVAASTLTANDSPGSGDAQSLQVVAVGAPVYGAATFDGTKVVYTPAADFYGSDTFVYTLSIGDPNSTDSATVTVTVTPVNDPPTAGNDAVSTAEDVPLTVAASVLTGNDLPGPANEAGQSLRIVPGGLGTPTSGAVTFVGGNIIYTPPGDFNGTATFTYTIDDGDPAATAVGTVTVTVTAVNDPPVAVDDAVSAVEDTPRTIAASLLLVNDRPGPSNESGQTLRIVGVGVPAHGTATVTGGGVVYTPAANYFGSDTFTYAIDDGDPMSTAVGTVLVTVAPVNDPPALGNDAYAVLDNALLVSGVPVLANDGDPDGDPLTFVAADQQSRYGAVVNVQPNGQFTYDPRRAPVLRSLVAGQSLDDTFTYQVRDPSGLVSTATVTVTVNGVTDPPMQNPTNAFDVSEDGMVSALDPLMLINYLNTSGSGPVQADPTLPYLDVNGDNYATAVDVITVINELNQELMAGAEGEAGADRGAVVSGPVSVPATLDSPLAPVGSPLIVDQRLAPVDARLELGEQATKDLPRNAVAGPQMPSRNLQASVFDELDLEWPGLDEVLKDITAATDQAAREEAADGLFALL
jgi:VCBS repeat-containing protein